MLIAFPGSEGFAKQAAAAAAEKAALAAPLQSLRGYWEALREQGNVPLRSQIQARGLEGILPGTFLIEQVAPSVARFRIAGSLIGDLVGCDARGMPISVLFEPRGRGQVGPMLEKVFAEPSMLDLRLEAERGIGRGALAAQVLILPLRNDQDETKLAIGTLSLSGDQGHRSRRFFVSGATVTPVLVGGGEKAEAPSRVEPFARPEPEVMAQGFAEKPAEFKPMASERSYLRLVRND